MLVATLFIKAAVATSLAWDFSITSSVPSSWTSTSTFVAKNSSYFVNIRILQDQAVCIDCASSLQMKGGYPVLLVSGSQPTFSSTQSAGNSSSFYASLGFWSIPLQTGSAGLLLVSIDSSLSKFTYSGSTALPNLEGEVLVNWIVDQGLTTTILSPSNLINSATGMTIKAIPGLSSNWVSILTTSSSSILLSSPDEFRSSYQVSLILPSSIYAKDSCTGSSLTTLTWNDVVFYDNDLYVSTNGGLLHASTGTSTSGLNWTSTSITICIKKIKQHSQMPVYLSFWNPLVVIGASGDEGTIALLSNQSGSPITLLDSQSRTMKLALFSSSSSFSIIDSVTSSVQKSVLFLVLSSSQYYLVTFDYTFLSWAITFCFPSTVPVYTSSLSNPFLRIWNTTSSVGAFDGLTTLDTTTIPLSLTGLQTSVNPSLDVIVMGNALFFSSNYGNSMNLAYTLSNSSFTSFSTHFGGTFALETSDSRLWLGSFGTYYIYQVATSRTSGAIFKPFFDYSGSLYELSYSSGSISRTSAYNYTNVLGSSGTCHYSNLSFVFYPDDAYLTALPTNSNYNITTFSDRTTTTTFLPETIYLDKLEVYEFQVRIIPTVWANSDSLKVSFQIGNSTIVAASVKRSLDYFRKTVIYDVSITDTGIPRTASYLTTTLKVLVEGDVLACQDFGRKTITINTGCHPTASLVFNPKLSGGVIYPCPHTSSDLPCAVYESEFFPVFKWIDSAENLNVTFTDFYTLQVVGGGSTFSKIQPYDSSSIAKFNPSAFNSWLSYIWTPALQASSSSPVFSYYTTRSIYWKCGIDSPCQYTIESPGVYYLTMKAQGVSITGTYCNVNAQFQIVLLNIPYPLAYDIVTAISTFLFTFLVLSAYLYYNRDIYGLTSKSLSAKKTPGLEKMTSKYLPKADSTVRSSGRVSFSAMSDHAPTTTIKPKITKSAKFVEPEPTIEESESLLSSIEESESKNEDDGLEKSGSQEEFEREWFGKENVWENDRGGVFDEIPEEITEEEITEDDDDFLLEEAEESALDGLHEAKVGETSANLGKLDISLSSLNKFLSS